MVSKEGHMRHHKFYNLLKLEGFSTKWVLVYGAVKFHMQLGILSISRLRLPIKPVCFPIIHGYPSVTSFRYVQDSPNSLMVSQTLRNKYYLVVPCGLLRLGNLYESIPRRMASVLKAKDGPTSYLLTYGAEPFLRSCQLCSHSENS
jgi:hypothetical protein